MESRGATPKQRGIVRSHAEERRRLKATEAFLHTYLHRWTPQFIADLKAGAKLDAYRMLGELMESVLAG
jgi:TorA maturation chaperone TorD